MPLIIIVMDNEEEGGTAGENLGSRVCSMGRSTVTRVRRKDTLMVGGLPSS